MYKIFINDKPFIISDSSTLPERYNHLPNIPVPSEFSIMDQVRKTEETLSKGMSLICEDPTSLFVEFKSHFTSIDAGGGIVFNELGEILLIKRLGKWDLPKGKIEPGEKIEEGAMREVEEECGVDQLKINKFLGNSYHSYKLQGHRFLKVTHWYTMSTGFHGRLSPQLEESITDVAWFNFNEINLDTIDTYESIREILHEVRELLAKG